MMRGTIFTMHHASTFTSGITASVKQEKFKRWAFSFQIPLSTVYLYGIHMPRLCSEGMQYLLFVMIEICLLSTSDRYDEMND